MQEILTGLMNFVLDLQVIPEISPVDGMYAGSERHYFSVGRSAMLNVASALACRLSYRGGEAAVQTILDFGCGHGRVARYLRAAFGEAEIDVTDLNRDGVEWCIHNLRCQDMGPDIPKQRYDLIWVGSVLTHLPETVAVALAKQLKSALRDDGVLIITTMARCSLAHLEATLRGDDDHAYHDYGVSRDGAAIICDEYRRTGFGYCDYPGQTGYGIALVSPEWLCRHLLDDRLVLLMAQERGWDTHQDVLAFLTVAGPFAVHHGRYF